MTIVCHQITCMQADSRHHTKFKNLCNLFISQLQLSDVERHGNLSFVYKVKDWMTVQLHTQSILLKYILLTLLSIIYKSCIKHINHLQSFLCCIQTQPGALRIQSFSVCKKSFLKRRKDFFLFSIKYFYFIAIDNEVCYNQQWYHLIQQ